MSQCPHRVQMVADTELLDIVPEEGAMMWSVVS